MSFAQRELSGDYYNDSSPSPSAATGAPLNHLASREASGYETNADAIPVTRSDSKKKLGGAAKKDVSSYNAGGPLDGIEVYEPTSESPKKQLIPFLVFFMIGTAELAGWNALLNGMTNVVKQVFKVQDYSDTVTTTYSTIQLVFTIIFIRFNVAHLYTVYAGLILSIIAAIVFGVGVQSASPSASSAIMHTLAGLLAVSSALLGSSAFGFAAQFPYNYGGAMSAGLGMAGVVTFVVWMIGAHGIWDESAEGTRAAIWLLISVIVVACFIALFLSFWLFNRAEVREMFEAKAAALEMQKNHAHALEEEGVVKQGTYETEGLKGVLRRSALLGFAYFCTLYVSLICFPILGPLQWKLPGIQGDVCMGAFQIMDLVGRYAPNYVPFMQLRKKGSLVAFAVARFGFVALFILSSRFRETAVIGQFWFMFLEEFFLALTNGWLCTCFFLIMPDDVEGDEAKVRVASVALLATFLGICAGGWTGKAIVSAF